MATTTTPSPPPTSPHEEVDNDNLQPTPPPAVVRSPPSPIEDVDHDHQQQQQFTNSNSPYSSPRTSIGKPESPAGCEHPQPEDVEDVEEIPVPASPLLEEKIVDHQQPSAPPSPPSLLQPSSPPPPPPPPPPTEPEHPPENLSPDHESPISKQPSSPPTGAEDPMESPNYRENPNPNPNADHESPSPSSPTTLQGNPTPKAHESPSPSSPKDPSPSPAPTAASPPLLTAAASSPGKPQTSPWTHEETVNLIQSYQEKWYSLKKGPLKASQWEEVAITVAARCGYEDPTKTAKQCRHKIEKLRKRYRSERGKPRSKATAWNFFKLMENLAQGPFPVSSSQAMAIVEYQKPSNSNGKKRKHHADEDDDDDNDREFLINKRSNRSKSSSNHHISNGGLARDLRVTRGLRTPVVHKHKGFYQEEEEEDEEEVAGELAAEIKSFAEKFVKMENKKIEMIRDVERYRLEMENKRMEMILESQQMLVETVNKAFHKTNKLSAN